MEWVLLMLGLQILLNGLSVYSTVRLRRRLNGPGKQSWRLWHSQDQHARKSKRPQALTDGVGNAAAD